MGQARRQCPVGPIQKVSNGRKRTRSCWNRGTHRDGGSEHNRDGRSKHKALVLLPVARYNVRKNTLPLEEGRMGGQHGLV